MQGDSFEVQAWRQQQREQLIAARQAINAPLRQQWQHHVNTQLLKYLDQLQPGNIGFYLPIRGELDCRPLATELINKGWRCAVPVMRKGIKTLKFCQWTPDTKMIPGIWGIPVPEQQIVLSPDVLIIPLVGHDRNGYRLGYGGGYYDRTLAILPVKPVTIGVGLEQGKLNTIHPHQFDIPMDLVVTEQHVLTFT